MSRCIWFGVAFLLLPSAHWVCDDAVAGDSIAGEENFERLKDRFREIVVEAAADFDSPIRDSATDIARKRYVDDRFDEVVRNTLKTAKSSEPAAIVWATKLMDGSSIDKPEQMTLLLDALIALEESFEVDPRLIRLRMTSEQKNARNLLVGRLQKDPKVLAEALERRLKQSEFPIAALTLAGETGVHGAVLLPRLLDETKSPERIRAHESLKSAEAIIWAVEKQRSEHQVQQQARTATKEKYRRYAERIIDRHDSNADGELNESEWSHMLMQPAAADSDQNGSITVVEYAEWMIASENVSQ